MSTFNGAYFTLQEPGWEKSESTSVWEVPTQLKSIMWEKDTSVFVQKLTTFFAEYFTRFPAFTDYMKRNYLDNNGPTHWVAAF